MINKASPMHIKCLIVIISLLKAHVIIEKTISPMLKPINRIDHKLSLKMINAFFWYWMYSHEIGKEKMVAISNSLFLNHSHLN